MAVATISIGLPIRIIAALNNTNFRGYVHWSAYVIEIISIALCFIIASRLETTDGTLAVVTRISAWIAIIVCVLLGVAPTPFCLW
jgi:hypothetical protein